MRIIDVSNFLPTCNSFILTCTNVWTNVVNWTEWQSVLQTSNCFDLNVSSIEINKGLFRRFRYAAQRDDVSRIKEMLEARMPVDSVDGRNQTTLMHAASHNRTDIIRLLLQKGPYLNKRNRCEAIAVLMEHGASINTTNNRGEKPIDLARKSETARQWNSSLYAETNTIKHFWNVHNSLLLMF